MMEERKRIEVVAAVIERDGSVFATQRGYGEWKDWWEFPGGKIEPGENASDALKREIREELATEIEVGQLLTTVEYDYLRFHLTMHCFRCRVVSGELDTVKWLPADAGVLSQICRISHSQKSHSSDLNTAQEQNPAEMAGNSCEND